jgi:hypothetical protein
MQTDILVKLEICIWEVLDSNLGGDIAPGKFRNITTDHDLHAMQYRYCIIIEAKYG